jgi:biotin transport system substrate-specific component
MRLAYPAITALDIQQLARPINTAILRLGSILLFVLLMTLGAFVRIPLPWTPVPVTLQTFFVLLSGAVLGGLGAGTAQLVYVGIGLAGLPVFAGAIGGLTVLQGATAGYLVAFPFAAAVVGMVVKEQGTSLARLVVAMIIGNVLILTLGTLNLALFLNFDLAHAFQVGFLPFLGGDAAKLAAAVSCTCWLRRLKQ